MHRRSETKGPSMFPMPQSRSPERARRLRAACLLSATLLAVGVPVAASGTTYQVDDEGRVTSTVQDGTRVVYAYDRDGQLRTQTVTLPEPGGIGPAWVALGVLGLLRKNRGAASRRRPSGPLPCGAAFTRLTLLRPNYRPSRMCPRNQVRTRVSLQANGLANLIGQAIGRSQTRSSQTRSGGDVVLSLEVVPNDHASKGTFA
jgi:YD repeat-containing protein